MKIFLSVFVAFAVHFLFPSLIWADDITTLDGKTYRTATVVKTEPDGITILYSDGGAKIFFTNLAPDLQKKYGYDPAKAAAFQSARQTNDEAQKKAVSDRAAKAATREEAIKNALCIKGIITQKFPDGSLLIRCDDVCQISQQGEESLLGTKLSKADYLVICARAQATVMDLGKGGVEVLLRDYPGAASMADGDTVHCAAYSDGLFHATNTGETDHIYVVLSTDIY